MGVCAKIVPRFFVPFEIMDGVGPISYKLALPPIVKAHNVFHVCLLNNSMVCDTGESRGRVPARTTVYPRQERDPSQEQNHCTCQGGVETLWSR